MSRIYDALSKAEQEATRKLFEGAPAQAASEQAAPNESAAAAATPAFAGMPATAAVAQPPTAAGLQCSLAVWNRDGESVLFGLTADAGLNEQFRGLRSRLYQLREKRALKRLLITSALPEEGKSFVALNLAHALCAQHGRKVLLVDADLRRARLHLAMGAKASPGLADCLLGNAGEEAIQYEGKQEAGELFFLPAGRHVEHPGDLLGSDRLAALMDRISDYFDWIVIDTPPVAPVSDASVLAKHCDALLLVVRAGSTPIEMAQAARQEFEVQVPIGVVFNGFKSTLPPQYQRGYYGTQRVQLSREAEPIKSANHEVRD
ncbi:MAG TPA: CpsD/CapB family tyrosine-protein kinase [Clostridia bacterium]|nr:CpsD/CapB family tyrosine-protein kinase [Clostridia bacterium]